MSIEVYKFVRKVKPKDGGDGWPPKVILKAPGKGRQFIQSAILMNEDGTQEKDLPEGSMVMPVDDDQFVNDGKNDGLIKLLKPADALKILLARKRFKK